MADRAELIRNAVNFLSDPNTQSSPLAQKIQFLEAKGLTPPEIDSAFKQAQAQPGPSYAPYPGAYGFPGGPPQSGWDWRDYFITAVVSGAVTYGAVSLFKKYLLPHLQPPTSTAYEQDKEALTAQFDAAEALLKEIQAETAAVKEAVVEQSRVIEKTTQDVDRAVQEMRDGEVKTRDQMREIRDEVNTIHEMLPKMIEKNKDSQAASLAELQQELKSLKALLLSRGAPLATASTPPIPVGRPAIPAWQLAATPSAAPIPLPAMPSPIANGVSSLDKGKAPELPSASPPPAS
ncbi:peroxisomal membrane anchor protein conserved region-domain-containing protein [Flagelloscypha sp. PMI_526]|nr:peroxisomal membrane anchor protein conserved region-domain-containing protein [Flagelloscypha sp. PMI_526]